MTRTNAMRIKTYFAKSVDQALTEARSELGEEAILLNTRRVPGTQVGGGGYEVILGIPEAAHPTTSNPAAAPTEAPRDIPAAVPAANQAARAAERAAANLVSRAQEPKNRVGPPVGHKDAMRVVPPRETSATGSGSSWGAISVGRAAERVAVKVAERVESGDGQQVAAELMRLHQQMDEIRGLIARSSRAQKTVGHRVPHIADISTRLLAADVEPALVQDIVSRLENFCSVDPNFKRQENDAQGPVDPTHTIRASPLEKFLRAELESLVGLAPKLGVDAGVSLGNPVVVLVGPRGAGKTTTLAKLAIWTKRNAHARPARMLSLDISRATAHVQLQSVASTWQIAFQELSADYLLPDVIEEARREEIVLVDTPGYTTSDASAMSGMVAALEECPGVDVHLVVPGYMKARDLRDCIERFSAFRPSKLLVTKMDEASSLGSVFSEAARTGLKLSFIAHGPGIPHDIHPASPEDLLGMAVERRKARAQHVA